MNIKDDDSGQTIIRNVGIGASVHFIGNIPFNTVMRGSGCKCAMAFAVNYEDHDGGLDIMVPVADDTGMRVVFIHASARAGSWHRADGCEVPR